LAEKYTYKEFQSLLRGRNPEVIKKAFLLANGMISVYGYDRESALAKAIIIAQDWYDNSKNNFN
jgi:uncharacterized protein YdaT